jgi:hypothetical protein
MSQQDATGGTALRQSNPEVLVAPRGSKRSAVQSASHAFLPVLLTDDQAAAALGVSIRKFHDLREEAWMPRPVVLERAVADMPRQTAPGPWPPHLVARHRIEVAKRTGNLAGVEVAA